MSRPPPSDSGAASAGSDPDARHVERGKPSLARYRFGRIAVAGRAPSGYFEVVVASLLTSPEAEAALEDLLRPEPAGPGGAAEQRVVFCGVAWNRYLAFDKKLGDDRPGPRLYYLAGELEIMTTPNEHERVKKWIGGFMDIYFEETGTEIMPRGQATMRLALKEAGAEPDESWCIGPEKEFPDLVLEIALTSGGIDKLEIYRRLHTISPGCDLVERRERLSSQAFLRDYYTKNRPYRTGRRCNGWRAWPGTGNGLYAGRRRSNSRRRRPV